MRWLARSAADGRPATDHHALACASPAACRPLGPPKGSAAEGSVVPGGTAGPDRSSWHGGGWASPATPYAYSTRTRWVASAPAPAPVVTRRRRV